METRNESLGGHPGDSSMVKTEKGYIQHNLNLNRMLIKLVTLKFAA